jgi:toxin ParE1/3/4
MAYRLAAQAQAELEAIWTYLASESGNEETADRVLDSIEKHLRILGANPFAGRSRADLRPGLRSFPTGSYLVIYRVEGVDVIILRVLHGRRDIQALLGS